MAVYLRLFHGRDTLNEEMNGFGFDGPVLGPLPFAHVTYGSDIKFDEHYEIQIVEGCVAYGGKFYGDFSIFDNETLVKCGYTPVAPCEADTVVDPSCRHCGMIVAADDCLVCGDCK